MTLCPVKLFFYFFFFNDTATTEIYTLSLHDALPIYQFPLTKVDEAIAAIRAGDAGKIILEIARSEEHTSELQSRLHLVCRLLLEKKKKTSTLDSSRTQNLQDYDTLVILRQRSLRYAR